MCFMLRNTTRRGRSTDPRTTRRMRRCRVARPSPRSVPPTVVSPRLLRAGLPDLLAHHFARVPDTLALVGIGRPEGPEPRGRLADEVLVRAAQGDRGLLVDLGGHALGQREHDRVRVAEGER